MVAITEIDIEDTVKPLNPRSITMSGRTYKRENKIKANNLYKLMQDLSLGTSIQTPSVFANPNGFQLIPKRCPSIGLSTNSIQKVQIADDAIVVCSPFGEITATKILVVSPVLNFWNSPKWLMSVIKFNPHILSDINPNRQTKVLCRRAVWSDPTVIPHIRPDLQTKAIGMKVVKKSGELLKHILPENQTVDMCVVAVRDNDNNIIYVAPHLLEAVNKRLNETPLKEQIMELDTHLNKLVIGSNPNELNSVLGSMTISR